MRPGEHNASTGQDTALRRSPRDIIRGRMSQLQAELHDQGIKLAGIRAFHTEDGPYGQIEILPAADTSTTLHELLARHGLSPMNSEFSARGEPVLRQHVRLQARSEEDARRRMTAAARECEAHRAEVIDGQVSYLTDAGALRLRLSPSSALGLGSLAALTEAAHRHDLCLKVPEIKRWMTGEENLAVGLACADDLFWRSQMPHPRGFLALRLAAVAASLSIDVTEVSLFQNDSVDVYGLVIGPSGHHASSRGAFEFPAALVLTVSPLGWHVGYPVRRLSSGPAGFERDRRFSRVLVDVGLAADAADIVTAAFDTVGQPPPRHPMRVDTLRAAPSARDGWLAVIGAAAGASVVVPFVQAMAGKAADDAYTALRTLLQRLLRKPEAAGELSQSADTGHDHASEARPEQNGLVAILDPETNTELVLPAALPDAAVLQLLRLDPHGVTDSILIWDEHEQTLHQVRRQRLPQAISSCTLQGGPQHSRDADAGQGPRSDSFNI